MSEWIVELAISGPIITDSIGMGEVITLDVEKGQYHPFMTTVHLKNTVRGISAKVKARAISSEEANDAAIFFFGQMLDCMCLKYNLPLFVSLSGLQFRPLETNVKRIVTREEWIEAFEDGRKYGIERPVFSRALSWHRKAVTSEDPLDKLIAFWSSIEGVASKFARVNERTKKGIVNKICDCLDQLWGETQYWKIIPSEPEFINDFHKLRNGIAHGFTPVYVDNIRLVAAALPRLRDFVYVFLTEWGNVFTERESERIPQTQDSN